VTPRTGGTIAIVEQTFVPRLLLSPHVHDNDVWLRLSEGSCQRAHQIPEALRGGPLPSASTQSDRQDRCQDRCCPAGSDILRPVWRGPAGDGPGAGRSGMR